MDVIKLPSLPEDFQTVHMPRQFHVAVLHQHGHRLGRVVDGQEVELGRLFHHQVVVHFGHSVGYDENVRIHKVFFSETFKLQ